MNTNKGYLSTVINIVKLTKFQDDNLVCAILGKALGYNSQYKDLKKKTK